MKRIARIRFRLVAKRLRPEAALFDLDVTDVMSDLDRGILMWRTRP